MAGEKDEKFDEKEMEKREEKSPQEKSWDEKWRRDPLSAIIWALIFIYAGVVLLLANLGVFKDFLGEGFIEIEGVEALSDAINAWPIVFIGAGVILLFEVLIRLFVPRFRKPVTGTIIFALILMGIGLGNIYDSWPIIFALILIFVGLSIVLRGFMRRSE